MNIDNGTKRVNFDLNTKLRLLISLINDEGIAKIETSMKKLISRILENYEENYFAIKENLTRA
jgi:hypothetical protein